MKEVNIVEVFEKFFLDFIGTIIPGCTFLFALFFILDITKITIPEQLFFVNNLWIFLIFLGYICGHALTSIGFSIIQIFEKAIPILGKTTSFKSKKELEKQIENSPIYLYVKNNIQKPSDQTQLNFGALRNIAMSNNTASDNQLIYRFMFISLFNLGIFTSLTLVNIIWLISFCLSKTPIPQIFDEYNIWISLIVLLSSIPFLERRYSFFNRAMRVPFDMVFSKLQEKQEGKKKEKYYSIYLAGGFKSNWQDMVINKFDSFVFYNPKSHNLESPMEYTVWDLSAIKKSDLIFAYLERDNPGGYALSLEIGYASALGKFVILIDEKSRSNETYKKNLNMIRECSDVVFETLNEGIDYLKRYQIK